jgi:hypothetical protein
MGTTALAMAVWVPVSVVASSSRGAGVAAQQHGDAGQPGGLLHLEAHAPVGAGAAAQAVVGDARRLVGQAVAGAVRVYPVAGLDGPGEDGAVGVVAVVGAGGEAVGVAVELAGRDRAVAVVVHAVAQLGAATEGRGVVVVAVGATAGDGVVAVAVHVQRVAGEEDEGGAVERWIRRVAADLQGVAGGVAARAVLHPDGRRRPELRSRGAAVHVGQVHLDRAGGVDELDLGRDPVAAAGGEHALPRGHEAGAVVVHPHAAGGRIQLVPVGGDVRRVTRGGQAAVGPINLQGGPEAQAPVGSDGDLWVVDAVPAEGRRQREGGLAVAGGRARSACSRQGREVQRGGAGDGAEGVGSQHLGVGNRGQRQQGEQRGERT